MTTSDEGRAKDAFEEGNRLFNADDFAGALAAYDRSLELHPDDPETLGNRGIAFATLGRYEEALAAHDRSLELRPEDPITLTNRGVALEHLEQHEEALAAHDGALALRPDHPGASPCAGPRARSHR